MSLDSITTAAREIAATAEESLNTVEDAHSETADSTKPSLDWTYTRQPVPPSAERDSYTAANIFAMFQNLLNWGSSPESEVSEGSVLPPSAETRVPEEEFPAVMAPPIEEPPIIFSEPPTDGEETSSMSVRDFGEITC